MEHPFFPTTTNRLEALRWLSTAEKLLSSRDLTNSKSFATRARDSDPTLSLSDQILAVIDTLLAADRRIGNNQPDWYGLLRLSPPQGYDSELISTQYRNLVLLLNPQSNKYPFADQAFRLILEAYAVLSNPTRKAMYDKELAFYLQQQRQSDPFNFTLPTMQQNFIFFGGAAAAAASSVAQPQVRVGRSSSTVPSHFSELQQVNARQVESVCSGSTRQPQSFMTFTSGTNFLFGSDSGPNVSQTQMNNAVQSFPSFAGGSTTPAVGPNQDMLNNDKQKQPINEHYSNASEINGHDVNVSENVGDMREDEVNVDGVDVQEEEDEEEERVDEPQSDPVSDGAEATFWTACPYCYCMYEYPSMYTDCSMRCQHCKSAFQAVKIMSPPPIVDGQEAYFCCWSFFPLGISMENWEKHKSTSSAWTPFSLMFASASMSNMNTKVGGWKSSSPRVYIDDYEAFMESSESESEEFDDVDWRNDSERKKRKKLKENRATRTPNRSAKKVQDELPNNKTSEQNKKGMITSARKQPGRAAKNFGKLDLNVEFSNDAEEPPSKVNAGQGLARGEEDNNIEGNGFFEGLDEYLSSLPILNGVEGDDKVVKVA